MMHFDMVLVVLSVSAMRESSASDFDCLERVGVMTKSGHFNSDEHQGMDKK